MSRKFKIGIVQYDSRTDNMKNMEELEKLIKEAALGGAELVILPEHADVLGVADRSPYIEDSTGPLSGKFQKLAKDLGIFLHCGSFNERSDEEKPYNTTLLFGPDGQIISSYRKLHMFDVEVSDGPSYKESDMVKKGDHIEVADTPLCKIGLSICYDLRFPELYRIMAKMGAELLVVSANFTAHTGALHWETLLRARAIENGCYVAASDQCGDKEPFKAYGNSMLIDPRGQIVARLNDEPGVIICEIDPNEVKRARREIPGLSNIREDIYSLNKI